MEEEESKEIPSVASYRRRWSGWEEKVFRTEAKEVLQLERKKRGPEHRWSKELLREIVLGLKSLQDLKPRRVQARLLHPQHLDRIWIGQDQYRMPLAPLSEYPKALTVFEL